MFGNKTKDNSAKIEKLHDKVEKLNRKLEKSLTGFNKGDEAYNQNLRDQIEAAKLQIARLQGGGK